MDQLERQRRIVEYLSVRPVNHGQVYTYQIAVPNSESIDIDPERFEVLSNSLTQQGTNLIPILVRRTEAYSEEEDYEVVYGSDWCIAAKELDIEKLWVWVFDLSDDEADTAKKEMEQLLADSGSVPSSPEIVKQFESLLKRFVEISMERALKQNFEALKEIVSGLGEKFIAVNQEIQELRNSTTRLSDSVAYSNMTLQQLKEIAKERGLRGYSNKKKGELIEKLLNEKE